MPDSIIKADNISSLSGGGVGFPDGSVSNPSLKFTNDGDTGLYRIGSNDIGVSAGGSKVLELDPNTFSTFQGGVERFRIASNGQISAVVPGSSTLYNGYLCRVWVNFDGTTTTPTIRDSGNVSSITRGGVGQYSVNLLVAMPDTNYCCFASNLVQSDNVIIGAHVSSVNSINVNAISNGSYINRAQISTAAFR